MQYRNFISNDDCARYIVEVILTNKLREDFQVINPVGKETLSIYEFALICADTYREISGRECHVITPARGQTGKPPLEFKTIHSGYQPTENIRSYLHQFIQMLIEERGRP